MKRYLLHSFVLLLSIIGLTISIYVIINNPKELFGYIIFSLNMFGLILNTKNLF